MSLLNQMGEDYSDIEHEGNLGVQEIGKDGDLELLRHKNKKSNGVLTNEQVESLLNDDIGVSDKLFNDAKEKLHNFGIEIGNREENKKGKDNSSGNSIREILEK